MAVILGRFSSSAVPWNICVGRINHDEIKLRRDSPTNQAFMDRWRSHTAICFGSNLYEFRMVRNGIVWSAIIR